MSMSYASAKGRVPKLGEVGAPMFGPKQQTQAPMLQKNERFVRATEKQQVDQPWVQSARHL